MGDLHAAAGEIRTRERGQGDFSIPLFFFEGTDDLVTPVEPAHAYFEQVRAPRKEFVLFKGRDHFLPFDRPDEFLAQLMERVRPLALSTPKIQ